MSCLFGNPKISEDIRISFDVSRYPLVSRILTGDPEPRSGYVWSNFTSGITLYLQSHFNTKKLLVTHNFFPGLGILVESIRPLCPRSSVSPGLTCPHTHIQWTVSYKWLPSVNLSILASLKVSWRRRYTWWWVRTDAVCPSILWHLVTHVETPPQTPRVGSHTCSNRLS